MDVSSLGASGVELLGIAGFIIGGAIYAAIDESITAIGEPRLRVAREGNDANARAAARYLDSPPQVKLKLLSGRVLCLAGTASLTYDYALGFGGPGTRLLAVGVAALIYAAAVSVSTTVTTRRASRLALPLLRFGRPFEIFATPVALPIEWLSRAIDRVFPPRPEESPERVTELDVEHMIEQGAEHGSIPAQNAELLRSVIEFGDTIVREIMVPRTSMVSIAINTPLSEVLELLVTEGHSRYPVYRERIDQIEGTLYAKDLFRFIRHGDQAKATLSDLIRRPVFFTAHSQKISVLLRQMQARRVHVAVVLDEFGGTSGMVTLEDIIEEIVGEIDDEHDTDDAPVKQIGPGRYIANADVSLYDLAEITGLELPEDTRSYESLGGMLVDMAGRVPRSGERIEVAGHEMIVRAADERRVSRVEVIRRKELAPPA